MQFSQLQRRQFITLLGGSVFSSTASARCGPLWIRKAFHRTAELLGQLLQFLARAALSINRSSSFTAA
jgi:hypothetical protein